jgi:hypothetical protein
MHTCSFCGKSEYQVGLYGGPQVAICTECVRTMYEDIGPLEPKSRPESEGETIVSFSVSRDVKPAPRSEDEK